MTDDICTKLATVFQEALRFMRCLECYQSQKAFVDSHNRLLQTKYKTGQKMHEKEEDHRSDGTLEVRASRPNGTGTSPTSFSTSNLKLGWEDLASPFWTAEDCWWPWAVLSSGKPHRGLAAEQGVLCPITGMKKSLNRL